VVNELRGERIDIIPWLLDPALFVSNALSPAQVTRVIINEAEKSMEVIVADEELSLAIGKNGQNVRLAARLTGWNITIKSESQTEEEKVSKDTTKDAPVQDGDKPGILEGLTEKVSAALIEAGLDSAESIASVSDKDLLKLPGLGPKTVEKLRELAISIVKDGEE